MRAVFLKRFSKDLDKIDNRSLLETIADTIEWVENNDASVVIPNLKKLVGYKNAYRIRIGDYRMGVFVEGDTVEFARILHRKDIYKVFP